MHAAAILRAAEQASRVRQQLYGGIPHKTADGSGNNLSLPKNDGYGSVTKFRAAFVTMANRRDAEVHGFAYNVDASATIPDRLNLTLALGDKLTYIPTGKRFEVVEIRKRAPLAVEQSYGLRRLEE